MQKRKEVLELIKNVRLKAQSIERNICHKVEEPDLTEIANAEDEVIEIIDNSKDILHKFENMKEDL